MVYFAYNSKPLYHYPTHPISQIFKLNELTVKPLWIYITYSIVNQLLSNSLIANFRNHSSHTSIQIFKFQDRKDVSLGIILHILLLIYSCWLAYLGNSSIIVQFDNIPQIFKWHEQKLIPLWIFITSSIANAYTSCSCQTSLFCRNTNLNYVEYSGHLFYLQLYKKLEIFFFISIVHIGSILPVLHCNISFFFGKTSNIRERDGTVSAFGSLKLWNVIFLEFMT